jgi:hypothetical protein
MFSYGPMTTNDLFNNLKLYIVESIHEQYEPRCHIPQESNELEQQ